MSRMEQIAPGMSAEAIMFETGEEYPAQAAKAWLVANHEAVEAVVEAEGKELSFVRTEFIQEVVAAAGS